VKHFRSKYGPACFGLPGAGSSQGYVVFRGLSPL
jgi:hypothetical protein